MNSSTDSLREHLERYRLRLLDLTTRNQLLNWRESRSRTVRIVDEQPEQMLQHLVREAAHVEAKMSWHGGDPVTRSLNDEIALDEPERVKYLPQNFVEQVCSDLATPGGGAFEKELKKVVFSKVAPEDQLGKRTLDELVEYPAWSPDGSTLAYAQHAPQGSGEIRLVDLASGISARLLDTPGEPAGLEWSHDGTAIVYALGGDIRLANPDVPGEWVSTGLSGHSATLSPDDGAIVYQATSGPSKALYRADLMTGEQAVLLSTKKVNYWMPDWRD